MNEETLFELALNTPPAEVPALLDRECANAPEMRARIEKLLEAHFESGGTMLHSSLGGFGGGRDLDGTPTRADVPVLPVVGSILGGKYKLVQSIGEGGMGSVFMAQQTEPVKRLVAVKFIKAGMDSKAVLARFEAERQALAMMDHPNIAKVLDAGATEFGIPYFVMELVKGIPITRFCDDNKLTPRQRLELFLPVCEAIQHSHQKGIIHRDIKPSNVLVAMYDDRAVPKVIDFGVAKATGHALTDADLVTGFGALVGTLEYMSPEQAGFNNLDIDTRTDVYSLGVLLYELLSGHTPVDRKSMERAAIYEILRIVREMEAPLLSAKLSSIDTLPNIAANRKTEPKKLVTQFRGELDWVLHKALEKDRTRRYSTANGLARDIQRYLSDEIVEARPPSTLYSLQKTFRRNKGKVLAASLVLLSLLAGFVGTTWGFLRAEQRRKQAEAAQAEEANQRNIAEANERLAVLAKEQESIQRTIAEEEKLRAIEYQKKALDALRATTGEDVKKLIGEKKTLSPNEQEYLEAIGKRWQFFASRLGNDQQSRQISAEGHFQVASLWSYLGRREEALVEFEQAEKIFQELVSEFPKEKDYVQSLAASHTNAGLVMNGLGRRMEALTKIRHGLTSNLKLTEEDPGNSDNLLSLAGSYHNLALVNDTLGNKVEALESYRQGIRIEEKLVSTFPERPDFRSQVATSHSNMGVLLSDLGRTQEAQEHYKEALAIRKRLAEDFPTDRHYFSDLATSHNNHGNLLNKLGKLTEAEEQYRLCIAIREKLTGDYPNVPEYANSLAASYTNLGSLLRESGKANEAISTYRKAIALRENLTKTFPFEPEFRQDLASSYSNLANVLRRLDKLELAKELHLKTIAIREKLTKDFIAVPEYRKNLAASYFNLGLLMRELDQPTDAEELYRKGLGIIEPLSIEFPDVSSYTDYLAAIHNSLGNLLADKNDLAQALVHYQLARSKWEKLVAENPLIPEFKVDLASANVNTALKLFKAEKPTESLEWFQKAIDLLRPLYDANPTSSKTLRYLKDCYEGRSRALDSLRRYSEGESDWNRFVEWSPPEDKFSLLTKRWKRLVRQGNIKDATNRVAELAKMPDQEPDTWYEYACVFSLAADRDPERKTEFSERAMELLMKAVDSGFGNAKKMKGDSDLKPIRDRDDFKKLLEKIDSKDRAKRPAANPSEPKE